MTFWTTNLRSWLGLCCGTTQWFNTNTTCFL